MAFPLFDNINEEQGSALLYQASWDKSLAEPIASGQTCHNGERSGFVRSTINKWGNKRGKNPEKIRLSLTVVHQADYHPLDTACSASSESQPDRHLQELDSSERHLTVPEGSSTTSNASQHPHIPSPTGSTNWDWECPAAIPNYDSNFKQGNLRRRNALHRVSARAKAAIANGRKRDSVEGPAFERRDSGSIVDEPIDIVRRERNSWGEDSTYYTSSDRSSMVINEMPGSFPSEQQQPASFPNTDEIFITSPQKSPIVPTKPVRGPQLDDSRTSWLNISPVSAHTTTIVTRNDVHHASESAESLTSGRQLSKDHAFAREIQGKLELEAAPAQEQEALDYELSLQLQQEEEEENRRQQEHPRTKACIICTDDLHVLDFHVKPPTSKCDHPIDTCHNCLQQWVASEFESNGWEHIKCPQCPQLLDYADMQVAADPELFTR